MSHPPFSKLYIKEIVNVISEEEIRGHGSQKVEWEVFFPHFRHPFSNSQAKDSGLNDSERLGIQSI